MKIKPSLHPFSSFCSEIDIFPNATIAEYGVIKLESEGSLQAVVDKVKAEVFARGPVAAEVNGKALHEYQGGIFSDTTASQQRTHIVSIVGWGADPDGNPYWVCRNSWGSYWGEVSFVLQTRP